MVRGNPSRQERQGGDVQGERIARQGIEGMLLVSIFQVLIRRVLQDFIVLSMHSPDPAKSPFSDLRLVVPIKLTTDPWSADEFGPDVGVAGYSDSSDHGLDEHEPPELGYESRMFGR